MTGKTETARELVAEVEEFSSCFHTCVAQHLSVDMHECSGVRKVHLFN